MTITDLITDLSQRGVRLWLDGEQLRFRAPQGTITSELKAQLAQRKDELREFLRQVQISLEAQAAPAISPVARDGEAPLSYSQERLWFTAQWEPESAAYNISDAILVDGRIDLPALEKSLNEIVSRHEILRTSFVAKDGKPMQRIAPEGQLEIRLLDLDHLGLAEREAETQRIIEAETATPFDLARSPLLRVALIRQETERHLLLVSAHHIISDGWSTAVLIHELVELYTAFMNGEPSPLPPLPIQYADFAMWQREWLAGERLESEAKFWREQLHGASFVLDLPTDRPRPAARTTFGATHHFELSATLSRAVRELSQREHVTPFMVLLAGWSVLLGKYSRQDDVLVGSAHAHRSRTELEGLIGFFVNTLVLRTNLSGDPSFRELLARVRDVTLSAQAHQDLPFEKLVDELQLERDLSRTPVYQVAFTFQNAPEAELRAPGLVLTRLQLPSHTAKFDLTLVITDSEPAMKGELEYSTDLFAEGTIVRMVEHLQTLLVEALERPEKQLSELSLLTAEERQGLLREWNDTKTDYPRAASLQELFERQVEAKPESVALVVSEREVSYRELNERANRLAHYLLELGVTAEMSVGICLERSLDMIVGLLGIIKAGGTYVPLDPEYPIERLAFMLEESKVAILLTDENLADTLPSTGAHVVCLDVEQDAIATYSEANPANLSNPDSLAYVMFTSGSTGKPKGIAVTHRNVVRLVKENDYAYFGSEERFLQFAPISFDASTFEIWGSLLNGACLVVFPQRQASLEELGQFIRETKVTVLWLTAGLFHQMVESQLEDLKQLRQLLAGGDVLSAQHVRTAAQELTGCRLTNGYGPTEGTTFTCCYSVDHANPIPDNLPIGRPIANTEVYILDRSLRAVPVGVPGELHISGDGLARGYVNQPALTAEKFIPNPFSHEPGARMYRTGDVARYLPNGEIEFLGRGDFQLKIRGFRIELGEIEAVLSRYVAQNVVVARENDLGDKQLVAYCVAKDGDISPTDLKRYLREHLPEYMIPSAFVTLDQLPLMPNGKVDRKSLPAPEKLTATDNYIAPRTQNEKLLAEIWADTLQVERIGINDNFFELGGHSLLAMQIVSRISDSFHVSLPLRALFELPTIAGLSERIQTALIAGQQTEVPPIRPVLRDGEAPLSYSQERLWFTAQWEPESAAYNITDAIVVDGCIDLPALEKSLNEIVRRHEILRTSFITKGSEAVQRIALEAHLGIKLIELDHLDVAEREAETQRILDAEMDTPFDLGQSPLLRVVLIRQEAERHLLVVSAHHIISDGWSTAVLIHELVELYTAFMNDEPSPLAPLPIQYADFAMWQREWLAGERLASEAKFWREQLDGASFVLDLPTDKPRPAARTTFGATHHFELSPTLSRAVRELSQREHVTPFMVLLAGWSVLLGKYSRQEDVLVGSAHAHRSRTELEGLIGFFVNTLVLRTNLTGDPSFRELLARVRDVTLSAQAHQDLPFEKLVDELQLERDLSRTPVYQVAFTFQNAPEAELRAPGLVLTRLQLPSHTAKFDLTLVITDSEPVMTGELEYSTDLFEAATIVRMVEHLETLLTEALERPEQQLSELSLLTAEERRGLLREWNDTKTDYPRAASLQQLFERQVEAKPEAVALVVSEREVSYRELNERANRLAHYLLELGVTAEMSVGICLERSLDMIVGLLGIIKAGGTYVPLDPEYPIERLAFMLEESKVAILLTDENLADTLPSTGAHVVCLDVEQDAIANYSEANPANLSNPDSLAYVMFTSGSTGKPKGIAVTHRNVVRLVKENDYAYFGSEERFLQFAPISFDASTFEIWGSLLNGACLVVFPQRQASLEELGQVIREEKITVLWLTAGLFHQMVESRLEDLKQLRQLLAGGDVLSAQHVRTAAHELTACRLTNGYGPTEGTTFTCCYSVDHANPIPDNLPIGRPIANTEVYILDRSLRAVPVGVPGELHISGDGLARGYVNQPALTAEKFIPNPFSHEPGARMYRTGDVARYLPNGEIEFLGRGDFQLKIRGFRIELGEIESVLSRYVAQNVVMARENDLGDKQLVAYCVAKDENLSATDLKRYLREHLPEYMIPSAFVTLDQLPLTPNGKVDRKSLPAPEKTTTTDTYTAPRTLGEELLAEIWADTLQLDRIDINDNFFELGGHSLLATQIVSRITDSFHVSLPLRALFEAPTIAGLSERIQTALISGQDAEVPPILPVPRDEALPLSFAQENLWLFEQLTPGTPTYNTCRSGRIWGPLNTSALESAFNDLLQRHEALRTSYEMIAAFPVQIVHPHEHYTLPILDISSLPDDEREAEALRLSNQDAQSPIDITRSPVARAKLLRLGDEEHVFILSIHHIAYDLWSGGVLLAEMEELYLARVENRTPSLPALPVQCADFGVWQRNWLQGEVLERQLAYWKDKLAGLSATPLDLPSDRPRPAVETMNGTSEYVHFPRSINESMQALARREGVTQFMVLMAVFQVLLHRYTNQDDVAVGSVIANRNRVELDNVVGFFDNPIVLRVDASGNPTFREFLLRVRDVALGAYSNQYVPFDLIVKELQPERTSNRTPFIQAMFLFLLNYPAMEREIAGLKVVPYNLQSGKAMFDLVFGMRATENGLEGELAYNCDLFDAPTIARLGQHFGQLMEAVVANPEQRIRELAMLPEAEQSQLLVEWNDTQRDYDLDHSMSALFERQVKLTPNHVAITCGGDQITYEQLNQRANQLAHYLRARGVGPEVQVGICLERSIDLVAGMLGVLKAGAAYVPLDPDYPAERVTYMLNDARTPILLTSKKVDLIAPEAAVERIYLDADWDHIAAESAKDLEPLAAADNLAYVIYTSGSTGQPKGVAITHRSAVSFLNWANEVFPDEQRKGLLAATSICFDLSIFELFLPLCFGGRLILVDNILALPDVPEDEGVTLINTVPSAIRELLREDELPRSAAIVNLAGEALPADLARKLFAALPNHRLYNLYGPSETTTYSTFTHIDSSVPSAPGIGRPVANTQVYVLDRNGNPAGTGVPGELYIGGVGLARGYLNRPALTAEKFVPNAFSTEPGARLYRTGDRVRWLTDGTLEFLGRIDHQVKVRGYRIELGEIESVLSSHPAVREAVVIVRDDAAGGQRLVAYLVTPEGANLSVADLRVHLQTKLPSYMVPGAFVTLSELPLTPNGKLDRKRLPAPEASIREMIPEMAEPRSPSEELVASVWRQVLGVDRVGSDENFFELGGHSLLATQVVSRVRKVFGVELELRQLFERPTVAGLARYIEASRHNGHNLSFKPMVSVPRDGELQLSFAQQRLWFLDKLVAGSPVYNMPTALRLKGELNVRALEQALTEIVCRHEALRTTFPEVDGQPLQVFAPPSAISLPLINLSDLEPAEREQMAQTLAETDAQLPLDLANGPLLRVSLIRLAEEDHVVLLTMHHIVSDGWSMNVLVRELTALYEAFVDGRDSPLTKLPIQYADFAAWQREWLSGEVMDAQLQFWKQRLAGISVLELPTDRPRPPVQSFTGAHESLALSEELSEAVKALSVQEGATLFMTLLAAFKVLLRHYTGQHDIVVGTPVANRNHEAIEGLIGFFVNTLVLRAELSDEMSFSELLGQVREVALDAYAHQDVPFEKLVEELQPERDLSRNPLVQVFCVQQNLQSLKLEMAGLDAEVLEGELGTTKFDLTLYITETENGLSTAFEYSSELFQAATIKRMLEHYERLLEQIVIAPDKRLSEISLLTEAERQELAGRVDEQRKSAASSASRVKEAHAYVAPRDEIEFRLTRIWESLLGVEGVGIRDNFFDLGGHSLLGVRLASRIKKQFGSEVSLGFLLQSPTIEALAGYLRQDAAALQRSVLVPVRTEGTRAPFFCVHPVGGHVLCYAALARELGPEQPFYAFQSPVLAEHTIAALAEYYVQQLRAAQPQGPYRLGGWSMGGVIAFEMARQLEAQGECVQVLALIDSYPPRSIARPEPHDLLSMFVEDFEGVSGRSFGFSLDDVRQLSVEESLAVLLEKARALQMVPDELGLAELQGLFELYRANLSALLAYEPRAYAGKVTVFASGAPDSARGWTPYSANLDVYEIEGDHYSIINGPPVKVLAARLRELLNDERVVAVTALR